MARNKYPEETVEKILTAARRLFLEKGYEHTTIQDIVDQLDGLTKGAVYHHFKSKEEILAALKDSMYSEADVFHDAEQQTGMNGLEKIRYALQRNQEYQAVPENAGLSREFIPLLENPRILANVIRGNRDSISPRFLALIQEGQRDGSIHTDYAQELAELLPLLELWLNPTIYPASPEGERRKLKLIQEMYAHFGIPLVTDEFIDQVCTGIYGDEAQ
ncbi:MAG: TetR/AcrR family transcriptional regulator [Clostridiales bacterium]|nr:TetR/AcrR family transcriptional regulator [Clostridiales bacterium]